MKRILVIPLLLALFTQGYGQTQAWSLEECMRYAVENSPRTAIQKAQNDIHKQNYQQAIASLLPSITGQVGASYNFGRALGDDNTYKAVNTFDNTYQLYASFTLFDGMSSVNRVKLEKVNRLSGRHKLQAEEDMVAYETMEAFFNALYYKQTVALAQERLEESSANLHQTERMAELGLKGAPDVAEMRAQEAADRYKLTQQKNMLAIGLILLKERMNFPVDGELDIAEYDGDELLQSDDSDAFAIYEEALESNPKAQAAEAEMEAGELSFKVTRGSLLPTLYMQGGVSTNYFKYRDGSDQMSFSDQFKDKRGEYFGFTMSIPIFDGLSRRSAKNVSRYRMEIARYEYENTLRELYSEIEQAVADVRGQADEYTQAERQVEAMDVAHDMNRRKYEQGLLSALELHTSANRLLAARTQLRNARLRYLLKHRLLEYYKGQPFLPEESVSEE